jgi:uncharacterized protein YbjT (DUF2867 family)
LAFSALTHAIARDPFTSSSHTYGSASVAPIGEAVCALADAAMPASIASAARGASHRRKLFEIVISNQ